MKKAITKKKLRSLTKAINQVLKEHGIENHSISNFSLVPSKKVLHQHLICPVGQKPCINPETGDLVCVPLNTPCG